MTRLSLGTLPAYYTSLPVEDGVGISTLARALNAAMADSAEHRAAYERIYGVAWEPLPYFATESRRETASSTAITVR